MKNKRTNIYLSLIFCILTTLACNIGKTRPATNQQPDENQQPATQESAPPAEANVEGLCDNPFQPVKQNASWTYFNTGSPSGDFTYTDTITEVRPDGFTLTSTFDNLIRTQEWACETGGIKSLSYTGGSVANIQTQGIETEFHTLEISGISYPKEIVAGMQWLYSIKVESVSSADNIQIKQTATYSATMQEAGTESITVPAGTFDARKFESTYTIEVFPEGLQTSFTITGTNTTWFAEGVGQIKNISTSDFGSGPFTVTTELTTYTIP